MNPFSRLDSHHRRPSALHALAIVILSLIGCLSSWHAVADPQEKSEILFLPRPPAPWSINPVFQDILSRVVSRDDASGAILFVRAAKGSSRYPHALSFSIARSKVPDEVVVTMRWDAKMNDGVYEKHRLLIDDAIREELARQSQRMADLEIRRETYENALNEKFAKLTDGKVNYRRWQALVREILGQPTEIQPYAGQRAGTQGSCDSWGYQDFWIEFHDGQAINIRER